MKQLTKFKSKSAGKVLATALLLGSASVANAVAINGSFVVNGAYGLGNGTDLGNTTSLILQDVFSGGSGSGDFSNITFFSTGSSSNPLDFPGIAVNNLLRIEGWQLDIDASTGIFGQDPAFLTISGNGTISCYDTALCGGSNFDPTAVDWNLSAQSATAGYSMTVGTSVVPVPAAVWLFGSGLLALTSVARKRRS